MALIDLYIIPDELVSVNKSKEHDDMKEVIKNFIDIDVDLIYKFFYKRSLGVIKSRIMSNQYPLDLPRAVKVSDYTRIRQSNY